MLAPADHTELAAVRVSHNGCPHTHMARTFRRGEHRCSELNKCSNRFSIIRDEEINMQAMLCGFALRYSLNCQMVQWPACGAVRQCDVRITVPHSATKPMGGLPEVGSAITVI